jgi:hypothetical protein
MGNGMGQWAKDRPGSQQDAVSVPGDRLTQGVTLGWLLNLFTP